MNRAGVSANIVMGPKLEEGLQQSVVHSEVEGLCRRKLLKSYHRALKCLRFETSEEAS